MSFKLPLQEKDILLINKHDYLFFVIRKKNKKHTKLILPNYEFLFAGLSVQDIEPILSFLADNLKLKIVKVKEFQGFEKNNFIYHLVNPE